MRRNTQGRVLITGGSGFIGSSLCWALNNRGQQDIVLADILGEDERWRNLVGLRYLDYVDANDLIDRLEENPDYLGNVGLVLHMGACSATTEKDSGYLMRNNFEYTKRLARWAVGHGARFLYASSAATYGDGAQGMDDRETDLNRFRPLNMYGYSKQLFDTHAQATGLASQIIGLKYFNVYGPNEEHKDSMRSVVGKAFDQIRDKGKVQLFKSSNPDYKDGEQIRDFLYIKDAVEMTLHLALRPAHAGLYNIGSGTPSTWVQLVTAIFESLGLTPNIEFIDMPEQLKKTYQYYTRADISKLRQAGYDRAISPLPHAVYDYVANYLAPGFRLGTAPEKESEAPQEEPVEPAPEASAAVVTATSEVPTEPSVGSVIPPDPGAMDPNEQAHVQAQPQPQEIHVHPQVHPSAVAAEAMPNQALFPQPPHPVPAPATEKQQGSQPQFDPAAATAPQLTVEPSVPPAEAAPQAEQPLPLISPMGSSPSLFSQDPPPLPDPPSTEERGFGESFGFTPDPAASGRPPAQ